MIDKPQLISSIQERPLFASFPDVPGALTCGDDRAETLELAEDALVAMLAVYVQDRQEIPTGLESTPGRRARAKLLAIDAAGRLDDLSTPPGNRLEALRADRRGQYSIRVNDYYG